MSDAVLLKKEAKNKKTSPSRLEELARHPDSSVQLAVAGNPNTPASVLEHLGLSTKLSLLKAVAKHGNTPLPVLERLARHQQVTVRLAVAETASPAITEAMAFQLLSDADEGVRYAVLPMPWRPRVNWNTSALFDLAAKDSSPLVRRRVALYCNDPTILQRLLSDPDWAVVADCLGNPLLDVTALTVALEQNFDQLKKAANWSTASRIVERRDLPAHWLERFSTHPNATVRLWIAKNPNTPRSVLLRLARDRDWGVLTATATLPDLPEEIYLEYAKHHAVFVRSALVDNPAISRAVLELLARDRHANPKTVMEKWACDMDAKIANQALKRLESMT